MRVFPESRLKGETSERMVSGFDSRAFEACPGANNKTDSMPVQFSSWSVESPLQASSDLVETASPPAAQRIRLP
jgi:hypothetical protein